MADTSSHIDNKAIADCVARFRPRKPHVHCITNSVAQHFTANVLLAAGATPSMTIAADEVGSFVKMADALLINVGTMDAERERAVDIAVAAAIQDDTPWALDPVFVQASPIRLKLSKSLVSKQPALIRCNAGEGQALLDIESDRQQLFEKARELSTTIAWTGLSDAICNSQGVVCVENGHHQMANITAMGCALTALTIGFMSVEKDNLLAATSAIALFGLAGDVAAGNSSGPGTFVPVFLDALHNLTIAEIEAGVKLS